MIFVPQQTAVLNMVLENGLVGAVRKKDLARAFFTEGQGWSNGLSRFWVTSAWDSAMFYFKQKYNQGYS